MDSKQRALAAEVRAEMGRQQIAASTIQKALGVSSTAWHTYFVKCTRDVPMHVVFGVATYLGVPASELMRRAEASLTGPSPALDPRLAGMMSPETRAHMEEQVARSRAERGGEVSQDPPGDTTKGRRSA
jgi:hypothetical protein